MSQDKEDKFLKKITDLIDTRMVCDPDNLMADIKKDLQEIKANSLSPEDVLILKSFVASIRAGDSIKRGVVWLSKLFMALGAISIGLTWFAKVLK